MSPAFFSNCLRNSIHFLKTILISVCCLQQQVSLSLGRTGCTKYGFKDSNFLSPTLTSGCDFLKSWYTSHRVVFKDMNCLAHVLLRTRPKTFNVRFICQLAAIFQVKSKSYIFVWSALLTASFRTFRVVKKKQSVSRTDVLTRCPPDILRGVNPNFFDRFKLSFVWEITDGK